MFEALQSANQSLISARDSILVFDVYLMYIWG
jgi:hypothetical protein